MRNRLSLLWFMLGLGNELQIIASLNFTELFCLIAAPFIYVKNYQQLRRDGVMPLFVLSLCVLFGCSVACFANHTQFIFALRGYAVTCIIPCSIVVSHWMIRRAPNGFKWFLLGAAISIVVCTFVFQKSVEVSALASGEVGSRAVDAIMAGPIFWISRLKGFVTLLTQGWYLHTSVLFDVPMVLFLALFSILTTASGRSASLSAFAFIGILLIGGKRQMTMRNRFSRKFWLWMGLAIAFVFVAKAGYEIAATNGWLGEESRKKYEIQTKGDKSLKALLLGGRMESFGGLIACADKPIVGFGPWAMDEDGYTEEFLARYATRKDYEEYVRRMLFYRERGYDPRRMIPCHAYLTEFWLWYGIFGLVFWLYILFALARYLKQDCWVVPQWFAWLACAIPGFCWGIFFSPLGNRFTPFLLVVACLMARAVRKGTFVLPPDMQNEILENERKRR